MDGAEENMLNRKKPWNGWSRRKHAKQEEAMKWMEQKKFMKLRQSVH